MAYVTVMVHQFLLDKNANTGYILHARHTLFYDLRKNYIKTSKSFKDLSPYRVCVPSTQRQPPPKNV